MIILSIDVGIKNLACLFHLDLEKKQYQIENGMYLIYVTMRQKYANAKQSKERYVIKSSVYKRRFTMLQITRKST